MSIHSADEIIKRVAFESGGLLDLGNATQRLRIQNKTAAYSPTAADSGTFFTTYGAVGSITFTLPATAPTGTHFWFLNSTAQDIVVATPVADTLYAYADDAADSLTSTNIAVLMLFIFDGNKWYGVSFGESGGATATAAVGT